MNLRRQPLRLEWSLTRDYINRAEKMREIEQRLARDQVIARRELAAYWTALLGVAGLCGWVYWNW